MIRTKWCQRFSPQVFRFQSYSSTAAASSSRPKLILRSTSECIHRNLALEDWFYQHHDFERSRILYLYRNRPCVVIGRHQNPWTEANVPHLRDQGIQLARRNSGGGCVYHDLGNLNLSFLTSKAEYNRRRNLELVCAGVRRAVRGDLGVEINSRDDIVVAGDRKVSGTAAKLSRRAAYHHCTLLVGVDTGSLHLALNNRASAAIETNATPSVRSPVENLVNMDTQGPGHTETLIRNIEQAVAELFTEDDDDGDAEIVEVDPEDEDRYPGVGEIARHYASWDWVFGKSPKFTVGGLTVTSGAVTLPGGGDTPHRFSPELVETLRNLHSPDMTALANIVKDIL